MNGDESMKTTRTETTVKIYDENDNLVSETTHISTLVLPDVTPSQNPTGLYL